MKLAVFGSASENISKVQGKLAGDIGQYLADKNITVVTGGSGGIPGLVVKSAHSAGARTEAYSPDIDADAHNIRKDNVSLEYLDEYKFIPGFTARSLKMIENVDAALVINGRIGTLSEFTIALEEGLDVGVVKGSGGIADHLEYIIDVANKEFAQTVIFDPDYKKVIDCLKQKVHGNL